MGLKLVSHEALEVVSTPSAYEDGEWVQEVCYRGQAYTVDLGSRRLVYFGESNGGSYRPYAPPDCTPVFANFCEYSGQRTEFEITNLSGLAKATTTAIPVPPCRCSFRACLALC